jgi:FKBP-type peptidyl-prolyl cis-trans isomerase 2
MGQILTNSAVKVHYTGKLEDGEVFDTSLADGREPLEVKLGEGRLIRGFEAGLIGLSIGDKKTIEIEPRDAYGEINNALVVDIPINRVPPETSVGDNLQSMSENGPINVRVVKIENDLVTIDANHPLAGQKLIFEIEVLNIV